MSPLRAVAVSHPELAEEIRAEANYFEGNKERMLYREAESRDCS
jgi:hypothetical protein